MRISWKNCVALGVLGLSAEYLYEIYKERRKRREICEVHFTNINGGCCFGAKEGCDKPNCAKRIEQRIIYHIDSAQSLICLAMYSLSYNAFVAALLRAKKRGVLIRLVTDKGKLASQDSKIHELKRNGWWKLNWFK